MLLAASRSRAEVPGIRFRFSDLQAELFKKAAQRRTGGLLAAPQLERATPRRMNIVDSGPCQGPQGRTRAQGSWADAWARHLPCAAAHLPGQQDAALPILRATCPCRGTAAAPRLSTCTLHVVRQVVAAVPDQNSPMMRAAY